MRPGRRGGGGGSGSGEPQRRAAGAAAGARQGRGGGGAGAAVVLGMGLGMGMPSGATLLCCPRPPDTRIHVDARMHTHTHMHACTHARTRRTRINAPVWRTPHHLRTWWVQGHARDRQHGREPQRPERPRHTRRRKVGGWRAAWKRRLQRKTIGCLQHAAHAPAAAICVFSAASRAGGCMRCITQRGRASGPVCACEAHAGCGRARQTVRCAPLKDKARALLIW